MDRVVQAGGLARLDPDPADELAVWEADVELGRIDDPSETRRRLAAYGRGEQLIVRLELFAEVEAEGEDDPRGSRYDGIHVKGLWFEVGEEDANRAHAREMIANHLGDLHRELVEKHGLAVPYGELAAAPLLLELDPELERRSAGGA